MRKRVSCLLAIVALSAVAGAGAEVSISGTRFELDGKPFSYVGLSFFNAVYNTNFNAGTEARRAWLKKFQAYGITVLRVWCQWDNRRGFADASSSNTLYRPDGSLRSEPLPTGYRQPSGSAERNPRPGIQPISQAGL